MVGIGGRAKAQGLLISLAAWRSLEYLLICERADVGGEKERVGVVVEAVGKVRVGMLMAGGSWRPAWVITGICLMELFMGKGRVEVEVLGGIVAWVVVMGEGVDMEGVGVFVGT